MRRWVACWFVVGFGHGGLERLEKKGEALLVGDGAARGKLKGGKAAEDRAEPSNGGVRAKLARWVQTRER